MTDDPLAPDGGPTADPPDDELVSAYLDDEVTAEERALVEGDATRRKRATELATTRDTLRQITPLTTEAREQMLAAVLRRLDQPVAPVVPVRRRRGGFDATKGLAVAAAVVMIGLLGFALALAGNESGDDSDSASMREEASITMADEESADAADAAGETEGADQGAPGSSPDDGSDADDGGATEAPRTEADLGDYATATELAAATRAAVTADAPASDQDSFTEDRGVLAACGPITGVRLRATLDGRAVVVDVPDDFAADIIVRDAATCERITSFPR